MALEYFLMVHESGLLNGRLEFPVNDDFDGGEVLTRGFVVLVPFVGRVQTYDVNKHFLKSWKINTRRGGHTNLVVAGNQVLIYSWRVNTEYTYSFDGGLVESKKLNGQNQNNIGIRPNVEIFSQSNMLIYFLIWPPLSIIIFIIGVLLGVAERKLNEQSSTNFS